MDQSLDVLSDPHRRRVLFRLFEKSRNGSDGQVREDALVGADDTDTRIEMHHVHLPKLDEEGFIRWDRERELVSKGPRWDAIEPVLTDVYDHLEEAPPA